MQPRSRACNSLVWSCLTVSACIVMTLAGNPGGLRLNYCPSGQTALLQLHNNLRMQHGVAPLQWSEELQATAQQWLDAIIYMQDCWNYGITLDTPFKVPAGNGTAYRMFAQWLTFDWQDIAWYDKDFCYSTVQRWAQQAANWKFTGTPYKDNNFQGRRGGPRWQLSFSNGTTWNVTAPIGDTLGAFAQMLWRGTTHVGCYGMRAPGDESWDLWILCLYSPPGNTPETDKAFAANLPPPKDGCPVPSQWCQSPTATSYAVDCDGDGKLDWACSDRNQTAYSTVLSGQGCKTTWNKAPASSCRPAFTGCDRPLNWCTRYAQAAVRTDCDGDGQPDWACYDNWGQRGALLSSRKCVDTWPDAKVADCVAVFNSSLPALPPYNVSSGSGNLSSSPAAVCVPNRDWSWGDMYDLGRTVKGVKSADDCCALCGTDKDCFAWTHYTNGSCILNTITDMVDNIPGFTKVLGAVSGTRRGDKPDDTSVVSACPDAKSTLAYINTARKQHKAKALTWSTTLEKKAQDMAKWWSYAKPGTRVPSGATIYHKKKGSQSYQRIDLFQSWQPPKCQSAAAAWVKQGKTFKFSQTPYKDNKSSSGDFAQVVWKAARSVGCGTYTGYGWAPEDEYMTAVDIVVCIYSPPATASDKAWRDNVA